MALASLRRRHSATLAGCEPSVSGGGAAARILELWPSSLEVFGKLSRTPRPQVDRGDAHVWIHAGKVWQYEACLRTSAFPQQHP